jgi:hypothetical protein
MPVLAGEQSNPKANLVVAHRLLVGVGATFNRDGLDDRG